MKVSKRARGVWGGAPGGLVLSPLAPRRGRRLNDSGVDRPRTCGHQRRIGDVRYASDSRRIAALPRTDAKGQQLTLAPTTLTAGVSRATEPQCRDQEDRR
jgi:hypothetical protein